MNTRQSASRAAWLAAGGILAFFAPIAASEPPATNRPAKRAAYAEHVRPLLAKYCFDCHSGAKPKAQLNLAGFADEPAVWKGRKAWKKVLNALRAREMPPENKPQPTPSERDRLTDWIEEVLTRPDATGQRDPGRVVLRRLTRTEYSYTIGDLIPSVRPRFPSQYKSYYDPGKGFPARGVQLGFDSEPASRRLVADLPPDPVNCGDFDNVGEVLTLSPVHLEQYLSAATDILDRPEVLRDGSVFRVRPGPNLPKRQAARRVLAAFLPRAFRRPVTEAEIDSFLKLFDLADRRGDSFEAAVKVALQGVLISPHFLFKVEGQDDAREAKGVRPVGQFELASRLSYFLWSSMPDEELFACARKGVLADPPVLEQQVRRMLKSPKSKALADNFAVQWLGLADFDTVAMPLPEFFPLFYEDGYKGIGPSMRQEAVMFFEVIAIEDRSILEFLDADWAILDGALAQLYGLHHTPLGTPLSGEDRGLWRRYQLPSRRRGGVLTMAAVLTMTSNPNRTNPVKRGKWILDNILGMPPPPPLPNVGTIKDSDSTQLSVPSVRQRLEQHRRNPNCASCHQRIDPPGLALENYDAMGAWRDTEWDSIEKTWQFQHAGDFKEWKLQTGWKADAKVQAEVKDGCLQVKAPGGPGPVMLHSPHLMKSAHLNKVVIRLENRTPSKSAELSFTCTVGPKWIGGTKKIAIAPNSGFREYLFDMANVPNWNGTVLYLRLFPVDRGQGSFKVDWVRIGRRPAGAPPLPHIDASGTLRNGKSFRGPEEFKALLKTEYRGAFVRCLTEKMLTYALGRKLDYPDAGAVKQITEAVARDHYKFSRLVLEVARSYPFLNRKTREVKDE